MGMLPDSCVNCKEFSEVSVTSFSYKLLRISSFCISMELSFSDILSIFWYKSTWRNFPSFYLHRIFYLIWDNHIKSVLQLVQISHNLTWPKLWVYYDPKLCDSIFLGFWILSRQNLPRAGASVTQIFDTRTFLWHCEGRTNYGTIY